LKRAAGLVPAVQTAGMNPTARYTNLESALAAALEGRSTRRPEGGR
jgi:hypothetical protein